MGKLGSNKKMVSFQVDVSFNLSGLECRLLLERGAALFGSLRHTEKSKELLAKDTELAGVIDKW